MSGGKAVAVVVVALVLFGGATAMDTAHQANGREYNHSGEEFDPSPAGRWVPLDHSDIDNASYYEPDRVTVTWKGDEMVRGEDWQWNRTNGSVQAVPGGQLDQTSFSQLPQIDYGYHVPREAQTDILLLFTAGWDALPVLLFVLMVGVVLAALARLAG